MEISREEFSFYVELHRKKNASHGKAGRMEIYEYFKVSDTDGSVLDFDEILKVELKNGNIQKFNTRWDEAITAMKKQPTRKLRIFSKIPSASSVRAAKTIVVAVYSRYSPKKVKSRHFCKQYTHLARIHMHNFSRACGSSFSSSHCGVLCVHSPKNIHHLARMSCAARCLTRH